MTHKVVVVESPAKAKTINKYLGSDYKVVASFGHIRDLPPKDGSVRPDEDFAMDWEISDRADRPVSDIAKAAKDADIVYLASDPDREGEAIAWHIQKVLEQKKLPKTIPVRRITFNEITKQTVLSAIEKPRDVDLDLVDSYMARRALDYLVGFSLSPVLWRKLPGSKSAGRVQSVALRLICQRESEIEIFKPQEFWTIEGLFRTPTGGALPAHLTHLNGKKLDKFALTSEPAALAALSLLNTLSYAVSSIERKQTRRNPYPPFTTSTLQQEASRKLGLGATLTMRIAQKLYEGVDIGGETVGLITYMRTDGVSLSQEAVQGARAVVAEDFGEAYLPKAPRHYKTTAKNAQEAHEAIRPTDLRRRPEHMARHLDRDALRLYTLIWQRTMASQMESAALDQVAVDIAGSDGKSTFRASGSTVAFDGWLKVYQDQRDEDAEGDEENRRLPPVKEKDALAKEKIDPEQHFTQPPPRYTEASLVKKLEELGIGRPSTYASIMQVLQDRDYVRLDKKRFVPEDRGRIVTAFLENYFSAYVEYDFTAALEEKLDDISGGRLDWKKVMHAFWKDFTRAIDGTKELKVSDVIDALDHALGPHFFPAQPDGSDPRVCTLCGGRMGLKLGRYGAFIGCSNYPTCKNTRPLAVAGSAKDEASSQIAGPRLLGKDPVTGQSVTARVGPYGAYVQLDPPPAPAEPEAPAPSAEKKPKTKAKTKAKKAAGPKPKRVSLPKGIDANLIDLETGLKLLSLPREIGKHPESGEMIEAGIGRFGSYIKLGARYKSLAEGDDVLHIGLNRAVALLAEPDKGRRTPAGGTPAKALGEHPQDGKAVTLNSGRFGPYVKWGKLMATVTKAYDPAELTLDQALEILQAKQEKGGTSKKPAAKKPAAQKPAAKKKPAAVKKTTAKKVTAKKTTTKKK